MSGKQATLTVHNNTSSDWTIGGIQWVNNNDVRWEAPVSGTICSKGGQFTVLMTAADFQGCGCSGGVGWDGGNFNWVVNNQDLSYNAPDPKKYNFEHYHRHQDTTNDFILVVSNK